MGRHATRNRGTHELVLETSRPYVQGDRHAVAVKQRVLESLNHVDVQGICTKMEPTKL